MEWSSNLRWDALPVPLSWVVELDSLRSSIAIKDALGDSYLCGHNRIFARIRCAAAGLGFRFSAEDSPMWRDYQAFSLTTLHRILSQKVIPYNDTGSTLARLLQSSPNVALSPAFILRSFKRNHVFHESAHCVASAVLRDMENDLQSAEPNERNRFVLEAVLAESFANTVEMLGSLERGRLLSDSLFYSLNSYVKPEPVRTAALEKAAQQGGENLRFTLLFLAFFEANLTGSAADDTLREQIRVAANCPAELHETVHAVTEIAFRLNARFRDDTTPAYFDLLGYPDEYKALARASWLGKQSNQQVIQQVVSELYRVAIGEFETAPAELSL